MENFQMMMMKNIREDRRFPLSTPDGVVFNGGGTCSHPPAPAPAPAPPPIGTWNVDGGMMRSAAGEWRIEELRRPAEELGTKRNFLNPGNLSEGSSPLNGTKYGDNIESDDFTRGSQWMMTTNGAWPYVREAWSCVKGPQPPIADVTWSSVKGAWPTVKEAWPPVTEEAWPTVMEEAWPSVELTKKCRSFDIEVSSHSQSDLTDTKMIKDATTKIDLVGRSQSSSSDGGCSSSATDDAKHHPHPHRSWVHKGGRQRERTPPFYTEEDRQQWEKKRRKKDVHNRIEQRRRYNINNRIRDLGYLLLNEGRELRQSKGSILKEAISYIQILRKDQDKLQRLDEIMRQLEDTNNRLLRKIQEKELLPWRSSQTVDLITGQPRVQDPVELELCDLDDVNKLTIKRESTTASPPRDNRVGGVAVMAKQMEGYTSYRAIL